VLSEEALIVLAAFGACGLLVLGVLELLWPTRPRHPVRRPPPVIARPLRVHRTSALLRHAREPGRSPYTRRASTAGPAPVGPEPLSLRQTGPEPLPLPLEAGAAASEVAAALSAREPTVEECFGLHQQGHHAEAIEAATAALARTPGAPETAALWSVTALARQAQGEDDAARRALEAAIEAAPAAERPAYQRQLAGLAEAAARARLAEAERHSRQDSEVRLSAIRDAAAWLKCGLAAVPSDGTLAELAGGVQAILWPAWERTVMALVQRRDFRAARRLLREALGDPRFPSSRSDTFRGLFSGTFSGEIGQLTAQAIRSMQDAREADALAALQRAETLLGSLNDEALSPKRREEVDRRLWWGYRALGERRLASGECEAALEPLFHALGYDVGPEQREQTRALLLRALDGVADARALGIRELADTGDREAAIVQCDKLWALLRSANETGLTLTELGGVYLKVQRLFETLGR
jgi:tetratricopeptide (TPR) repeat protein